MKTQYERRRRWALLASVWLGLGVSTLCVDALAQRQGRPVVRGWHGDIARFHEQDWGIWRTGRWTHQRHDGRLGWWWVAGGLWYYYPSPVYPYPSPWEPPPVVVTPPVDSVPPVPPTEYWYLCEGSNTYYPYVATCPGGWKQVPAVPANAPTVPLK